MLSKYDFAFILIEGDSSDFNIMTAQTFCENGYSEDQIRECEMHILNTIEWDTSAICTTEIAVFLLQLFFYRKNQEVIQIPGNLLYQFKHFTSKALVTKDLYEANYCELAAAVIILSLEIEYQIPEREQFLPWVCEHFRLQRVASTK